MFQTAGHVAVRLRSPLPTVNIHIDRYETKFKQICSLNMADRVRRIALMTNGPPTFPSIPEKMAWQEDETAIPIQLHRDCMGWDDVVHLESVYVDLCALARLEPKHHIHFMSVFEMPGIREVRMWFGSAQNPNPSHLGDILQKLTRHVEVLSLPLVVSSPIMPMAWDTMLNRKELCIPLRVCFRTEIRLDSNPSIAVARCRDRIRTPPTIPCLGPMHGIGRCIFHTTIELDFIATTSM